MSDDPTRSSRRRDGRRPISIWQPREIDGEPVWVRPPVGPLGDHYATTRVLRTKPGRGQRDGRNEPTAEAGGPVRRVCWFGESAAAGYLYAPHATPARVLEHLLGNVFDERLRSLEEGPRPAEPPEKDKPRGTRSGRGADTSDTDTDTCKRGGTLGGSALGGSGYEVIDLARTNETLDSLVETVESALQLDPDLLVVYAGNNWPLLETPELSPHAPSPQGRRQIAAAFDQVESRDRMEARGQARGQTPGRVDRADGPTSPYAGPAGLARKRLAERATTALDRLAGIARGAGIPLLLVLPEVNLADWESRQPPAWLPGDGTARWYRLLEEGLAALDRGDSEAAESAAWEMNTLDGSTCPTPFRLLARAWEIRGEPSDAPESAVAAALAEVDTVHYPLLCFLDAPRATTDVRRLLTDAARRHGLPTVDLRTVFAKHTGSPLPGRRLFLDYCHLTFEAMTVLGAAVAEQVLRLCPLPAPDRVQNPAELPTAGEHRVPAPRRWQELLTELPPPALPPAAEATARLGAAVHGAHRLLPLASSEEILEHWCRRALDADPGVARAMLDLASARLALLDDAPAVLTAGFRRLQASPYRMTLQHGLRWNNLDGPVLRAMTAALDAAGRSGRVGARELERLIVEAAERLEGRLALAKGSGDPTEAAASGSGIDPGIGSGIDLAGDERFLAAPLERLLSEVMDLPTLTGRATLRAFWPITGFDLPATGRRALDLELTARLPPIPGLDAERTGTARVTVDGHLVGKVELTESWTRTAVHIPPDALRSGLHRLQVHWPEPPTFPDGTNPSNPPLGAARRRLREGLEADLHPIFGEIHALVLRRTVETRRPAPSRWPAPLKPRLVR